MKTKIVLLIMAIAMAPGSFCQLPVISLTFSGIDSASYARLDSIRIINRSWNVDTVLYYPDTVLHLTVKPVGILQKDDNPDGFRIFVNESGSSRDQAVINLFIPEKDEVKLLVTGMSGRQMVNTGRILDRGLHQFRFSAGRAEMYLITAVWKGRAGSVKVLVPFGGHDQTCSLGYQGITDAPPVKSVSAAPVFFYNAGMKLLYIAYSGSLQSAIPDMPTVSKPFVFQFASKIPCPGIPSFTYMGQVYNTIQVFSQCWMKENLNAGTMLSWPALSANNGIIEKYCYNNQTANCNVYGGLYKWEEVMQYASTEGVQGICPQSWHIPTDEDWKVLEGGVDSLYRFGDPMWDYHGYRGFNAGLNLKANVPWNSNYYITTDPFHFSAMPAGVATNAQGFGNIGFFTVWWSSTLNYYWWDPSIRAINGDTGTIAHVEGMLEDGYSLRCLRDY